MCLAAISQSESAELHVARRDLCASEQVFGGLAEDAVEDVFLLPPGFCQRDAETAGRSLPPRTVGAACAYGASDPDDLLRVHDLGGKLQARREGSDQLKRLAMKKIPKGWDTALMGWVSGTALADILTGPKVAVFINDHVAFKMVWAAEAVRAQAVAREHMRAGELGDGPALAFTHGVPSRQAALLCQSGFASRTGAVWATRSLAGSFSDMLGLRVWEHEKADSLAKTDFWETPDQHLLWAHRSSRQTSVSHAAWSRWSIVLQPTWFAVTPDEGTSVRIMDDVGGCTICSVDLAPSGAVATKPAGTYHLLRGTVQTDGSVAVWCFGPKPWPR